MSSFLHKLNTLTPRQQTYLALAVFALLTAVFYGNTLANGFVMDDRVVVEENIYIQSLEYAPRVVTGCIWEYVLGGCRGLTLHYRPIHTLSYLVTYQISSNPAVFHFMNLLYFFSAVSLVFWFVRLLTKKFSPAFFAALIFLAHPINTEVVNWVSAVSELTFIIFVVLTLVLYLKYRENLSSRYFILIHVGYFFAMLSKELAVFVVPLLIAALDLIILRIPVRQLFKMQEIKKYAVLLIPLAVYFAMRMVVLGGLGGLTSQGSYLGGHSAVERINAFFNLFAYALVQIMRPAFQFFHAFTIEPTFASPRFIISVLLFLIFWSLAAILIRVGRRTAAFAMIVFFIFFLPMLIFFSVAGDSVFAERYLFGSSIGFALLVGLILDFIWDRTTSKKRSRKIVRIRISRHFVISVPKAVLNISRATVLLLEPQKRRRGAVVVLLTIIIAGLGLLIVARNTQWRDNETFLRTTLAQNPAAHSMREYLAFEYRRQGDWEAARREYETLIERGSEYRNIANAYSGLADYWRQQGNRDKAVEYYAKALELNPNNYRTLNNIGAFYSEQEEHLRALVSFCQALQLNPNAQEAQENYNRIAGLIQGVPENLFIFLYQDLMFGGAFQKEGGAESIIFKNKSCNYGSCIYRFSPRLEGNEALFPFLIMAEAFPQEVIRVSTAEFNQQTNEIAIGLDEQYRDRLLTFYFPSCSGSNYTVETSGL